MDMGFWPDVQKIMTALPPDRQTLLFSATLPGEIQTMAKQMLREPRYVQVGTQGGAARTIDHQMVKVDRDAKIDWLATFAKRESDGPVLVFVRRKVDADRVARHLVAKSIKAAALHADRSQQERLSAVEGFRSGKHPVLVATDIAARGLDIEELPHVVNFDLPHVPEDYVHRIGRTGRAGSTGEALSLVCAEDRPLLAAIERLISKKIEVRNADGFDRGSDRAERPAPSPQKERPQHHAPRQHAAKEHAPRQHAPKGHAPKREHREPRHERQPKREQLPDFFSKPYEPSPSAQAPAPSQEGHGRKRPATPVPALFRKKAA